MRKFKMKEKYFRIYMVLGAMLLIVGVASIINDNVIGLIASGGSKIKIAYPIIITILGICVIMKALRCCVEIGDSKIIYCNGLLPKKEVEVGNIDYIFMEHKNKFIIHSLDNKKIVINYIFNDLSKFNKTLKKYNVKIEKGY